jgi:hypothetical protein
MATLRSLPLAVFMLLATSGSAFAGNPAAAEKLFRQGIAMMQRQDYEPACRAFEASQREDPSPGTQLNLGVCYEMLGRTATAWATYMAAAELAHERGRKAQAKDARGRADALEPRLSKLRIDLPPAEIEALEVLRDGQPMAAGSFGVALALDPGTHKIEARAPGRKSWSTTLELGKEADARTVQIPDLAVEQAPAPAPASTRAPVVQEPSSAPDPMRDRSSSSAKTIGYVLGGVGIAAIGVGSVFGLMAAKQASDAEAESDLCPDKQCSPKGRSEINSAKDKAFISTFGFGVGIAALAAGVVLVLTSDDGSPAPSARSRTTLVPSAGPQGGFVSIAGSFQ